MSKSKRSTVLIVDPNQTQSIEVNTQLLRHLKPILMGLGIATVVLSIGVVSLVIRNYTTTKDNQALRQKVGDLEGYTSAEVNAKINELRKSEKAVLELQNYLQERGAFTPPPQKPIDDGKPNSAAGGPALKISAPMPFMGSFAQNTQNLLEAVKKMPLGLPAPTEISSRFGNRFNPFTGGGGEFHPGLDFRGEIGDPIKSTASGMVNFAGYQNGYGNVVRISLDNGYEILFGHMSEIDVRQGQTVHAGDMVGKVGSTGRSTGPHIHYEIRKDGTPIDPEPFLTLSSR
ncbi:MAG: mepM [Burkholderiaceae bacterium]|nr:mepM [Burkholderiaceae bacterium]